MLLCWWLLILLLHAGCAIQWRLGIGHYCQLEWGWWSLWMCGFLWTTKCHYGKIQTGQSTWTIRYPCSQEYAANFIIHCINYYHFTWSVPFKIWMGMYFWVCHVIFGPPMQTLKTNPAIQILETNPANHSYPEPSPWPFWISAIVDNMHGGPYISEI